MKRVKIGNRVIGENEPCFIIAEAGVNHNGDIELAKKLIDAARDAGADAVKFQTFKAEEVVTKDIGIPNYAKKNMGEAVSQINMLKKIELKYEDFQCLKRYCDQKNILFLSTPHSFDAIDFLEDLVPAYKFGSGDVTNIPALKYAAKKNKPLILGTGMSTLNEVKNAVDSIRAEGNDQIILLHCTTNYPCLIEEINLRAMKTMQRELDCLVGYSDHTLGISVPVVATAMGAVIIEKHFTINKNLPGPDHKASLTPDELTKMIREIRNTEKIFGSFEKKPTKSEEKTMDIVRKSIVAKKDIKKESTIEKDMITIKRPGTGLKPSDFNHIIGKKTKSDIKKDTPIKKDQIYERILITGGAGFIGSSLIKELATDFSIVSLDLDNKKLRNSSNVEFINGSILDEDILDKATKNVDSIIHLAGGGGETKCLKDPAKSILTNIIGTELLIKHAKLNNVPKIIFASSIYTYSSYSKRKVPIKETDKQQPDSFYGSLKLACEEIIKNSGIDYVILRFSNVYGAGSDLYYQTGGAIGNFIDAVINDSEITVYNGGKNQIDYLNVADVATVIKKILEKDIKNEIFNLGGNSPITVSDLAKLVINVANQNQLLYDKKISTKTTDASVLVDLWSETSKASKQLSWKPKIDLEKGIEEMINFRRKSN